MKAQGEFKVTQWNESNLEGFPADMPMSRASVIYEANGEIAGTFRVEYIMHYVNLDPNDPHGAQATYLGYMMFTGAIGGKTGSFILEDKGVYGASGPASDLVIKPGSGKGDFVGISGTGKYYADGEKMIIKIDYTNGNK